MTDPDALSALHEAAHATVACALGVRVRELSIVGGGEGGGECVYDAPHGIDPRVRLRIALAGSLGTLGCHVPFRFVATAGDDRQTVKRCLKSLHGPEPWPGAEPHAAEFWAGVSDVTQILRREIEFHRSVAGRLRRDRRLDGATVHEMWRQHKRDEARWRHVGAGW